MVFGMCATRAIAFVIGIGKDVVLARKKKVATAGTTKDQIQELRF